MVGPIWLSTIFVNIFSGTKTKNLLMIWSLASVSMVECDENESSKWINCWKLDFFFVIYLIVTICCNIPTLNWRGALCLKLIHIEIKYSLNLRSISLYTTCPTPSKNGQHYRCPGVTHDTPDLNWINNLYLKEAQATNFKTLMWQVLNKIVICQYY